MPNGVLGFRSAFSSVRGSFPVFGIVCYTVSGFIWNHRVFFFSDISILDISTMKRSGYPILLSSLPMAWHMKSCVTYLAAILWNIVLIPYLLIPNTSYAGGLEYETHSIKIANAEYQYRILKGYSLDLVDDALAGPRMITRISNGDLLIGSKSGNVYHLNPPYTKPDILMKLHDYPHSVAVRDQYIFIARTDGLYRANLNCSEQKCSADKLELYAKLPGGRGHTSRTVKIDKNGHIYISLGISSNCSNEYLDASYPFEKRRGGIAVLDETQHPPVWKPYAAGLRNPVGYDWNPVNGLIYSSNNGPDHLGYENPREYFSEIRPGSFHGMPWFQMVDGKIVRDRCIQSTPPRPRRDVEIPVATFPARNAPMGVRFISKDFADERLRNNAIVALHGSWGTKPDGGSSGQPFTRRPPKLVMVRFERGKVVDVVDFLTGFQQKSGIRWARPVDIVQTDEQHLYFTSDGGIPGLYGLRYGGPAH